MTWHELTQDPPEYAREVAALIEWGQFGHYRGDRMEHVYFDKRAPAGAQTFGNYDARTGPLAMFLDMIDFEGGGWCRWTAERFPLGYLEAEYIGDALGEWSRSAATVEHFIGEVFAAARAESA